jgi:hypothetical protein
MDFLRFSGLTLEAITCGEIVSKFASEFLPHRTRLFGSSNKIPYRTAALRASCDIAMQAYSANSLLPLILSDRPSALASG